MRFLHRCLEGPEGMGSLYFDGDFGAHAITQLIFYRGNPQGACPSVIKDSHDIVLHYNNLALFRVQSPRRSSMVQPESFLGPLSSI
jgi:hypothetical protein